MKQCVLSITLNAARREEEGENENCSGKTRDWPKI